MQDPQPIPGKSICESCGSTPQSLLRCSGCKQSFYCSAACQRKDWPKHKSLCAERKGAAKSGSSSTTSVTTTTTSTQGSSGSGSTGGQEVIPTKSAPIVTPIAGDAGEKKTEEGDKKTTPITGPLDPKITAMLLTAITKKKSWKEIWDGCPHRAALNSDEPCVPCQNAAYEQAKEILAEVEKQRGLEDPLTLAAAFDLEYCLITSYRLTECDQLLSRIFDVCKKRGKTDTFYIQEIQALAFLRYKQSRYEESCELFEEMQQLLGPNERLLENMGHAYNSIGQTEKAENCFKRALDLIDQKEKEDKMRAVMAKLQEDSKPESTTSDKDKSGTDIESATAGAATDPQSDAAAAAAILASGGTLTYADIKKKQQDEKDAKAKEAKEKTENEAKAKAQAQQSDPTEGSKYNRGGVLLGLGMCKKSLGKHQEAFDILSQALNYYLKEHKADHSIVAKVAGHVADVLCELGRHDEAEPHYRDAIRIFKLTCGDDSPLTCSALHHLGTFLVGRKRTKEAEEVLLEALERTVRIDQYSIKLKNVVELLASITTVGRDPSKPPEGKDDKPTPTQQALARKLVVLCKIADEKMRKAGRMPVNAVSQRLESDAKDKSKPQQPMDNDSLYGMIFYQIYANQCVASGMSMDEIARFAQAAAQTVQSSNWSGSGTGSTASK